MPKKETRFGRQYLIFDDPEDQAFYDALFALGNPDSATPFDVNDPKDLSRLGIINTDPQTGEERISYPLRFDPARTLRSQYLSEQSDPPKLLWRNAMGSDPEESSERIRQIEEEDPELWKKKMARVAIFLAESYVRRQIKALRQGKVVVMDRNAKEYPRFLQVKINDADQRLHASLEDIPPAEPVEKKPEEPERPNGWFVFWYDFTNGALCKDKVEPYLQAEEEYNEEFEEYWEEDTCRRVCAKEWPEYAAEGKKAAKVTPPAAAAASVLAENELLSLKQTENNLLSLFGPAPGVQPGIKSSFLPVFASIPEALYAVPPEGFTPLQSAAFTHLAMFQPATMQAFLMSSAAFKDNPEHPMVMDRDTQLFIASGHLQDIQLGRNGSMSIFSNELPNGSIASQAHLAAKLAYDAWQEKDFSAMGRIFAANLRPLTRSLCRNETGFSPAYAASMQECEILYGMLQEHPELKEYGLAEEDLAALKANHTILEQYQKSTDAFRQLLCGKEQAQEELVNHLTDALTKEYLDGMLRALFKNASKDIGDQAMAEFPQRIAAIQAEHLEAAAKLRAELTAAKAPDMKKKLEELDHSFEKRISQESALFPIAQNTKIFHTPADAAYLRLQDPEALQQIRENIRNGAVMQKYLNLSAEDRTTALAHILTRHETPEVTRLLMDLAADVNKPGSPRKAAPSKPVLEKTESKSGRSASLAQKEPAVQPPVLVQKSE